MSLPVLIMNKRLKHFIASLIGAGAFAMYLSLPVESSYYGLLVLLAMVAFLFWFGLGLIFEGSVDTKIMVILLPGLWTIGFGLFATLLPSTPVYITGSSLFFGVILYTMFLVNNVFLVAIGYKTVPLYRAAYTVSLIILLLAAFFLFDSLFSFKLPFWGNMLAALVIGLMLFTNNYWNIAIELPDDGKEKGRWPYIIVPSIVLSELIGILSFWPVGIFRGSVYLIVVIYIISALIQAEIRDRLFRGVVRTFAYMAIGAILAMILTTKWGG